MNHVSQHLIGELRDKLRRHPLVVWLDNRSDYTPFVDSLPETDFGYPVIAFRGSYIEALLALEDSDARRAGRVLVHVPTHTDESIRETPLFDVYAAGSRFERNVATLVTNASAGLATPGELEQFLAKDEITLEAADRWLADRQAVATGGLAGKLAALDDAMLVQELRAKAPRLLPTQLSAEELQVVLDHAERRVGMPCSWLDVAVSTQRTRGAFGFAIASWAMAVEYVHDLDHAPVGPLLGRVNGLPKPVVAACGGLAGALREHAADDYERMADDLADRLASETQSHDALHLGRIDTFRFETTKLLEAALSELSINRWARALELATQRAESFWIGRDRRLAWAWAIVTDIAQLHAQLAVAAQAVSIDVSAGSLHEETRQYVKHGATVDRSHRELEQRVAAVLDPALPHYAALRGAIRDARAAWRKWADVTARRFARACRDHGPMPTPDLRQRSLFDEEVAPILGDGGRCVVLLVDALRYELAQELRERIDPKGKHSTLSARLAELPSITAVGMNALAPIGGTGLEHASALGNRPGGFRSGECTVKDPSTRARAMAARVGDTAAVEFRLEAMLEWAQSTLEKKLRGARLIVVHTKEIDDAGEAGTGPHTFATWLRRLTAAWRRLQDAGLRQFVFAADHGFLLQDETTRKVRFGRKIDPHRRWHWTPEHRTERGLLTIRPTDLGYRGVGGCYLFPEDTAEFDTGRRGSGGFVHGGNSPQERIIPVLVVRQRYAAGGNVQRYLLEVAQAPAFLGAQCCRVRVRVERGSSFDLTADSEIELTVTAAGDPAVQTVLRDARGARVDAGRLFVSTDGDEAEVYFTLTGPADGRTRLRVFALEQGVAEPVTSRDWFEVTGRGQIGPETSASGGALVQTQQSREPAAWSDGIEDPGYRQVLAHIQAHAMVTEAELVEMLGSSRRARRFARHLDGMLERLPFAIRVETTHDGKRYVKE